MAAALDGSAQQSGLLEDLHVLGRCREGHVERLGQLTDRPRRAGQPAQHGAARWVAQRAEHTIQRGCLLFNHVVEYSKPTYDIQPNR